MSRLTSNYNLFPASLFLSFSLFTSISLFSVRYMIRNYGLEDVFPSLLLSDHTI